MIAIGRLENHEHDSTRSFDISDIFGARDDFVLAAMKLIDRE